MFFFLELKIIFLGCFVEIFVDGGHLMRSIHSFFEVPIDLFLISHNRNHFFFHFFIGLKVLLPYCYVGGVFLYETEYFLDYKVINSVVLDLLSMLLKLYTVDVLNFL